jgi:hypothetical protein
LETTEGKEIVVVVVVGVVVVVESMGGSAEGASNKYTCVRHFPN